MEETPLVSPYSSEIADSSPYPPGGFFWEVPHLLLIKVNLRKRFKWSSTVSSHLIPKWSRIQTESQTTLDQSRSLPISSGAHWCKSRLGWSSVGSVLLGGRREKLTHKAPFISISYANWRNHLIYLEYKE